MPGAVFGGAKTTPGKSSANEPQPHDYIRHSIKTNQSKTHEFRSLYESGLSLRQIEARTGYSKTKIRKSLLAAGVVIRDFSRVQRKRYDLTKIVRAGNTPFGYCYLENALVVDPHEYKVVLEMARMWQSGQSLRAISRHLNNQKIPTRFGKSWKHEVVKNIIERHLKAQKKPKKGR